jgi:hypothetical protein
MTATASSRWTLSTKDGVSATPTFGAMLGAKHPWYASVGIALSSFMQGGARGGAAGLAMAVRADQQIGVVILSLLAPSCANR